MTQYVDIPEYPLPEWEDYYNPEGGPYRIQPRPLQEMTRKQVFGVATLPDPCWSDDEFFWRNAARKYVGLAPVRPRPVDFCPPGSTMKGNVFFVWYWINFAIVAALLLGALAASPLIEGSPISPLPDIAALALVAAVIVGPFVVAHKISSCPVRIRLWYWATWVACGRP